MTQSFSFGFDDEDIEKSEQNERSGQVAGYDGGSQVDVEMDVESSANLVQPSLRTLEEMVGFCCISILRS